MDSRYCLTAGISTIALLASLPAAAQTANESPAAKRAPSSGAAGAEIVVTATRRRESILDVPISVQALSQETLDTKGVRNIDDIARQTPGVTFETGFSGTKYIAIRGLFSSNGATMTGVYIDDTPVQVRSVNLTTNFYPAIFDLDRVEILRGPQGTLFGAGAMGGAVRFIQTQPGLQDFSGSARAELAFTENGAPSWEAGAAVGGPLVKDKLGFRISGYHRRDGGYIDRIPYVAARGTAEKNSNSRDTTVANAAITIAPTETFKITPSIFYQKLNRNDTDQEWLIEVPTATQRAVPDFVSGEGVPSFGHDRAVLGSVKAEWDIGGATLFSNTAFLSRRIGSVDDGSAFLLDAFGLPFQFALPQGGERATINLNFTQRSFTQELRLQSNGDSDSRLGYILGLFYQNARQTAIEHDRVTVPAIYDSVFGLGIGADGEIAFTSDRTRDRQYAAFGQLDYKLTDRLTFSAGVRLARMEFDFDSATGGPFFGNVTTTTSGKSKETPVTPRFSLEYRPSKDLMVYATAAKGFRSGGANAQAGVTCAGDLAAMGLTQVPQQYSSDTVWSYEIGAKGKVGSAVTFAASAYDIEWSDIQRTRTLPTCAFIFLDNLGKARSVGFDASITVVPTRGLTLDAGIGYMDVTQRETLLTPPNATRPGTIVTKGDRFALPWIVSASADYEAALGGGSLKGYGHVQYDYKAGYDSPSTNVGFNSAVARNDAQHFASARLGVRSATLDLSLFVNNLFNSRDELGKTNLLNPATRLPSNRSLRTRFRPRTVGVTAGYRF